MISFVLQPFNKEHVVVFTMSGVAALSKLTYVKYNLPQEVRNFCFSKKFNLAFFFLLQPKIFLTSEPSTGIYSSTQF